MPKLLKNIEIIATRGLAASSHILTNTAPWAGPLPFVVGREIHTAGQPDGRVLADITPGLIGDNEVVIKFRVKVDGAPTSSNICNQGFVDYEANLLPSPDSYQ